MENNRAKKLRLHEDLSTKDLLRDRIQKFWQN